MVCPYDLLSISLTQLSFVTFTGNLIAGTRLVDGWEDDGRELLERLFNESSTDVNDLYNDVLSVFRGIAGMFCIDSILYGVV